MNTFDVLKIEKFEDIDHVYEHMIEIKLKRRFHEEDPEIINNFGQVSRQLKYMGVGVEVNDDTNVDVNTLFQSVHICRHNDKYYLSHFKLLFSRENLQNKMNVNDVARQNKIASILNEWGMIELVEPDCIETSLSDINYIDSNIYDRTFIHIIKKSDVSAGDWILSPKYNIRKKVYHAYQD